MKISSYGELCPSLLYTYTQTKKQKEKKLVKWCIGHQFKWALTWFCCVLAQFSRLWSYRSGKPPSMLFFYPWIKTEKTVSWRQMRLTAGTEWKVSFNLGLGYNLSGLIGAKHHSFHHGEDVMLIHLNKGTIWVAWLLDDLHKLFSSFKVLSEILKWMRHIMVHLLHTSQLINQMSNSFGWKTKWQKTWKQHPT